MRRVGFLLLFVLLFASPVTVSAMGRHFVFTPVAPLTDAGHAELAARGITVQKVLGDGRYLVAVDRPAAGRRIANEADLPAVGAFEALRPEWKVDRSVARELARSMGSARLRVLFHDDVTIDEARAAIAAAGGALRDPLQVTFGALHSLSVAIPAQGVDVLASDERVFAVGANRRFPVESHTANAGKVIDVATVQAAPYNLTGEGVELSIFELSRPDVAHPAFEGRVTPHGPEGESADAAHATHVAGIIMAAPTTFGLQGMAPKARLHTFIVDEGEGEDTPWLDAKDQLPTVGSLVDNNSWGYVLGWKSKDGDWIWNGYDAFYGAYDLFYTASIDQITRQRNVLFVHSSGNDAGGANLNLWAQHKHVNRDGSTDTANTYCYSRDGSGADCPASPTCTAGRAFCETTKHMTSLPYGTVGVTASGKNTIAVGSVNPFDKSIASSSSRGPARDGRVKPDLVAPGVSIYSTLPGGKYGSMGGTSMAAPMVTGTSGLLIEQWRKTFAGANPLPAELKALFVAGAEDLGNSGPDYTYGFGMINAKASIDLIRNDAAAGRHIRRSTIATGQTYEMTVNQLAAGRLRVVLHWTDPEIIQLPGMSQIASKALVNDLDVKVIGPTGAETLPFVLNKDTVDAPASRALNNVDNTEVVEIASAAPGAYRIVVTGREVKDKSPQEFVLVSTAAGQAPCIDLQEKGDDASTAYGVVKAQRVNGALCSESDVDYYRFAASAGRVSVRVTTGGTAVRVTLLRGTASIGSAEVGANSSGVVSADLTSAAADVLVKVERVGEVGLTSSYSVTPEFVTQTPAKRRSTRK